MHDNIKNDIMRNEQQVNKYMIHVFRQHFVCFTLCCFYLSVFILKAYLKLPKLCVIVLNGSCFEVICAQNTKKRLSNIIQCYMLFQPWMWRVNRNWETTKNIYSKWEKAWNVPLERSKYQYKHLSTLGICCAPNNLENWNYQLRVDPLMNNINSLFS